MLVNVGYGNMINADKIIGVSNYNASPIKRMVSNAKDYNRCVDMTMGKKTNSVIFMEGDYIVLSASIPATINKRMEKK